MSALSEACWHAGWLDGTERVVPELCRRALEQQRPQRWGHGELPPAVAHDLVALATRLGHWATLDDTGEGYVPFPPEPLPGRSLTSVDDAIALLVALGAPPHLVQHHRLVAEAATALCDGLAAASLDAFDRAEVLVGAALHDAGKVLHPHELHRGGSEHERAGHRLLLDHGVPERLARHAWLHAAWTDQEALEPILVALADKLWKGHRVADLEERATRLLAAANGRDLWAAWADADAVFEAVAASSDERLARSVHPP